MGTSRENDQATIKIGAPAISRRKVTTRRTVPYMWAVLCDAEKHIGWDKNATLNRIILRKVERGWQAIVKAERGSEKGVAFITGRSLADCLEILTLKISDGDIDWKKDKPWP